MTRKRKIMVWIATSADGFIARADGSFGWLDRPRPKDNYRMGAFYRSIDTIRWGRKTCDITLEFEEKGFVKSPFDTRVKNYVFTRTRRHPQRLWGSSSSTNRSKPSQGACGQKKGKDISIMVGAGIIASFLDEGEIDEFIISVVPATRL